MIYDLFSLLLLYHLLTAAVLCIDTIVFLLIFPHQVICTFIMPSRHFSENQSKSHFQIAVSTYYALRTRRKKLRRRGGPRRLFASRHGSNFLHGCPFQVVLPFRSWNTTWIWKLSTEWRSRKNLPKFSSFQLFFHFEDDLCCNSQKIFDTLLHGVNLESG